jgi:hypothetical protein
LDIRYGQIEYIARLVEEEELEEQDKKDGVKGMLEGLGSVSLVSLIADDCGLRATSHGR